MATDSPYADAADAADQAEATRIPNSLGQALTALQQDTAMCQGFGQDFVRYYQRIKTAEQQRFDAAEDKLEFQRREYFNRI